MEARRAQGLDALTLRWFGMSLPPDEDWVVLTYSTPTVRCRNRASSGTSSSPTTLQQLRARSATRASAERRARLGVDVKTELLRRVRKALFDPPAVKAEADMAAYRRAARQRRPKAAAAARRARAAGRRQRAARRLSALRPGHDAVGHFGYVRLATFAPDDEHDRSRRADRHGREGVRAHPPHAAAGGLDPRRPRQRRRLRQLRRAHPADAQPAPDHARAVPFRDAPRSRCGWPGRSRG